MRWAFLFASWWLCGSCAAGAASFYPGEPHAERAGAYEWFLVAAGAGRGADREAACEAADAEAHEKLTLLLLERSETQSDVVAAAGGPSRLAPAIRTYAAEALPAVPRTQELYQDDARRCFVQLKWLLPRHLAAAVRRGVEGRSSADDVGVELRRALQQEPASGATAPAPVQRGDSAAPTPNAVLEAIYPGWFTRVVPAPDCPNHRLAFVGAPAGTEARWLELKQTAAGWIVVTDKQVAPEGWPSPPDIPWCD